MKAFAVSALFTSLCLAAGACALASCATGSESGFDADASSGGDTGSTPPADGQAGQDSPAPGDDSPSTPDVTTPMDAPGASDSPSADAGSDAQDSGTTLDAPPSDSGTDGNLSTDATPPVDASDASSPDAADAGPTSGIPTSGLVGEWLCSGNTNDTSGNGNNGTGTNVSYMADRHGTAGASCYFNGGTASISIPSTTSVGVTTTWSVSAWINPTGFTSLAGIVSKYQTNNAKGPAIRLAYNSPFTGVDIDEATNFPDGGNGELMGGKWTHVGATVNGTTVTCYINGVVAYTGTAGYTAQTNTDSLFIGVDYANRFFYGLIDDVRLYNRTLSASEIEQLYVAP